MSHDWAKLKAISRALSDVRVDVEPVASWAMALGAPAKAAADDSAASFTNVLLSIGASPSVKVDLYDICRDSNPFARIYGNAAWFELD